MKTDTSERGLERLICTAMTGHACDPGIGEAAESHERPVGYGTGWIVGLGTTVRRGGSSPHQATRTRQA